MTMPTQEEVNRILDENKLNGYSLLSPNDVQTIKDYIKHIEECNQALSDQNYALEGELFSSQ